MVLSLLNGGRSVATHYCGSATNRLEKSSCRTSHISRHRPCYARLAFSCLERDGIATGYNFELLMKPAKNPRGQDDPRRSESIKRAAFALVGIFRVC